MPMKQKLELMRCSKVLVPLFLQVLYYSKEEGKRGRKGGGKRGTGDGQEKEGEEGGGGRERKGDKNTYLGWYSCNSVETEQAAFGFI